MPPKPRFSREDIVNAGLAVISEKGVDALTAREVAKRLGSSTRPIFRAFKDMDELKNAVRELAANQVHQSAVDSMLQARSYIAAEVRAIRFAMEYPNLYQLVFLTGDSHGATLDEVLADAAVPTGSYATFMQEVYGLGFNEAKVLFDHLWVHTLGIGTLCATRGYVFPVERLEQAFSVDFWAMYDFIKAGGLEGHDRMHNLLSDAVRGGAS